MKTLHFEIVCSECGSKNVVLSEWHSSAGEGMRLTCKDCKTRENL